MIRMIYARVTNKMGHDVLINIFANYKVYIHKRKFYTL